MSAYNRDARRKGKALTRAEGAGYVKGGRYLSTSASEMDRKDKSQQSEKKSPNARRKSRFTAAYGSSGQERKGLSSRQLRTFLARSIGLLILLPAAYKGGYLMLALWLGVVILLLATTFGKD